MWLPWAATQGRPYEAARAARFCRPLRGLKKEGGGAAASPRTYVRGYMLPPFGLQIP